jgi:hypothetical protein
VRTAAKECIFSLRSVCFKILAFRVFSCKKDSDVFEGAMTFIITTLRKICSFVTLGINDI